MTFMGRLEVELDVWHCILLAEYSFQASCITPGTLSILENVDHVHVEQSSMVYGIFQWCEFIPIHRIERSARLDERFDHSHIPIVYSIHT